MTKPPSESVIFHGEIFNRKDMEKNKFPIGCKFSYKNASYNDVFTVVSIRIDPGTEYRQLIGNVAGEVWMMLSSLQREASAGAITYIEPKVVAKVVDKPLKEAKKAKVSKKPKGFKK